jgi:hypothetical protein
VEVAATADEAVPGWQRRQSARAVLATPVWYFPATQACRAVRYCAAFSLLQRIQDRERRFSGRDLLWR